MLAAARGNVQVTQVLVNFKANTGLKNGVSSLAIIGSVLIDTKDYILHRKETRP